MKGWISIFKKICYSNILKKNKSSQFLDISKQFVDYWVLEPHQWETGALRSSGLENRYTLYIIFFFFWNGKFRKRFFMLDSEYSSTWFKRNILLNILLKVLIFGLYSFTVTIIENILIGMYKCLRIHLLMMNRRKKGLLLILYWITKGGRSVDIGHVGCVEGHIFSQFSE